MKSGSLKLLEPSGPAQVCDGIVLPFYIEYVMGDTIRLDKHVVRHVNTLDYCYIYAPIYVPVMMT
jgi:hypothetical protein